ncbi:TauD/TfdA family dioxygenase [Micromonospora sp. LH3U1]|uniref:TauD/TfdA family dioxygenase n=1 Tax=Micromonospora sp. LH3U1 TaxID=3018339 RepID=UPI0023498712|nr:TauD/TfdA family dioxygenase [Micromonospora sp. LH3U1]WCN83980.1 TauD/TfdA family dioxygenase [Micromonospora sp. LH3U1]
MRISALPDGLPAVISNDDNGAILDTVRDNRAAIRSLITEKGAVLFRGFDVGGVDGLHTVVRTLSGEPLDYTERSSPRSSLSGNVFTSTDYPESEEIFLHNECSYQQHWPMKVYFYCITPSATQGATPFADVRKVLEHIDPAVVEEFTRRKWSYVRNFGPMGGTWQYFYDTDDRAEVERYCAAQNIQVEWIGEDGLRTRAVRDAVHRHPVTGAEVWFNHATFFHVDTLPGVYREEMLEMFGEENLPTNSYYGDGGQIPAEVTKHLQEAYRAASTRFDWQKDDLVVIDNMLTAHGREPYTGARKIAIAMGEASNAAVEAP